MVNISEDAAPAQAPRVFGCVIFNSFELVLDPASGTLERAFLEKKQELYNKVFPTFYVLGWYRGSSMDVNKSPIYLVLNPAINLSQKDLPVVIYENERISVDHVAHLKPSDGGSAATQLAAQLSGIHNAIKMVNTRIHVIHQYLVDMQKGDIPVDNSLLRQVASLLRRLAAMESEKFQDDFLMHDQQGC